LREFGDAALRFRIGRAGFAIGSRLGFCLGRRLRLGKGRFGLFGGSFGLRRVAIDQLLGGFGRGGLCLLQRFRHCPLGVFSQIACLFGNLLLFRSGFERRVRFAFCQGFGRFIGSGLLGSGFADLLREFLRLGGSGAAFGAQLFGLCSFDRSGGLLQLLNLFGLADFFTEIVDRLFYSFSCSGNFCQLLGCEFGERLGIFADFFAQRRGGNRYRFRGSFSLLSGLGCSGFVGSIIAGGFGLFRRF
jgi:hypothetical protein